MLTLRLPLTILLITMTSTLGSAAAPTPTPDPNKPVATQIAEHRRNMKLALAQIETLNKMEEQECVGDGECEDLELGESRCGGPSRYLVVSTNNPNLASIKALVSNYTSAEKSLHSTEMGEASCGTLKPADPRCKKNKCVDNNLKSKN